MGVSPVYGQVPAMPGVHQVSVLYTAKIEYSTPLLRKYMADLSWVLKPKQRICLFSLLLLPLLFLSFSFFPLPRLLGEPLDPKSFENVSQVLSFQTWSHFQHRSFVQA